ncbi:sterile alpha motif domain-containing protein 3-like [Chanodichthys erythropterus]
MSNLEEIKLAISSSLPGLSDETLQKFIHGLSAIGVETKDDLRYVKEEDLMEFLRPIQCRKLLNAWKNEEQSSCSTPKRSSRQVLSDISSPGSESSSSTPSRSTACFSASCAWAETFKVSWEVMPSEIKLAIANKKRPSPADRKKLVRMLVDNMQKHEVNPSKAQCQIVVQNIVKQYPESFADVLSDGTKIGSGYASLLMQVKTRVEHVNRNNTLARRRKERLRSSCRTISQSSRRLADQYGCVSWQPEEFPAGENDDTLEEKRKQMVLLHSTEGMSGADRGELHKLMEVTYYRQRRDINATPPLSELKNSWPYLFCLKGIFLHFQLLTDISLLQKIMESIEGKGKRILRFFQEKPTNKEVCAVLSKYQEGNSLVLCILKLLMAHFKERTESLLIEADAAATAADMEREGLPDSPALIIQGESMTPSKWMLSVEREVVLGPFSEAFVEGLAALFATYYNLNLAYQDDAACTLEFIQRGLVGINPETGSKVAAGKRDKKMHGMNPHVCTLLRKLMDFEWLVI